MKNTIGHVSEFRRKFVFVKVNVLTYGLANSVLRLSQQILQLPMAAVCTILWHSHPPISNGIVFVWVVVAVSSTWLGTRWSTTFILWQLSWSGSKGKMQLSGCPSAHVNREPFDVCCVLECGFDMMEAFSSGECKKVTISVLSFSTPFLFSRDWHAMPFSCTPNSNFTCEHFTSPDAFGILLAGFYESVLLCISHNNPCHWMLGLQMMQTKLQLLHSYYNSAEHTCIKGLFILNRGWQIINLNARTQYYMMENLSLFFCYRKYLFILDAFEG